MAKDSAIEWCDHTFNPWHGCVKISEGCKNCYAEARQFGGDWWGKDKPRRFFGEKHWQQPIRWNAEAEELGVRYKVFCGSYCDVFEKREDLKEPRERLGKLIQDTPHLDWLLLTKRPENVYLLSGELSWVIATLRAVHEDGQEEWDFLPFFPENVWLGVSVENQKQADIRIPELLKIPAKVRFLSCEPLLEKVLLDNGEASWLTCNGENRSGIEGEHVCCESEFVIGECFHGIDWVIVGGESGPNARPMNPDWARSIHDQCKGANVSYFLKQMGTHWAKYEKLDPFTTVYEKGDRKGANPIYWPPDLNVRQFLEV